MREKGRLLRSGLEPPAGTGRWSRPVSPIRPAALFTAPIVSAVNPWDSQGTVTTHSGRFPFSILLASALLLLVQFMASGASAEPAPAEQRVEAVRVLMEEGQALFAEGHAAEAARIFERGFERYPFSAFLFNAGVCHEKAAAREAALRAFERYLEVDPKAPDAVDVRGRIARLKASSTAAPAGEPAAQGAASPKSSDADMKSLVVVQTDPKQANVIVFRRLADDAPPPTGTESGPGWLKVSVGVSPLAVSLDEGAYRVVVEPIRGFNGSSSELIVKGGRVHDVRVALAQGEFMGHLKVTAVADGATVFIDDPQGKGRPWGTAPHSELVPTGKHTVTVVASGYLPYSRQIDIETGAHAVIDAALERISEGRVRLDSAGMPYELWIDGKLYGDWKRGKPRLTVQLSSGEHRLELRADDHKTWSGPVLVPQGQVLPLSVRLAPKYPRGTAWVQGSIAAVLVGGGVYCGLRSNALYDAAQSDRKRGVLSQQDGRLTEGKWFAAGADAGFVLGGIMAALSTYSFLRDPYPESAAAQHAAIEFDEATDEDDVEEEEASPQSDAESETSRTFDVRGLGLASTGNTLGITWGGRF
jgi:tetratricopeptide (TPR) repeat protein